MNFIAILNAYLSLGIIFAIYFVFYKIRKIDTSADRTTLLFKLLIFGGCVLLWPWLINKKNISHR